MGYEIWGAKEISKKKQKYRRKQRKREIELHRLTVEKQKERKDCTDVKMALIERANIKEAM